MRYGKLKIPASIISKLKYNAPTYDVSENYGRPGGFFGDYDERASGYKAVLIYIQNGLADYLPLFKNIARALFQIQEGCKRRYPLVVFGFGTTDYLQNDGKYFDFGYANDWYNDNKVAETMARISGSNRIVPAIIPELYPKPGTQNPYKGKSRIDREDLLVIIGKIDEIFFCEKFAERITYNLRKQILFIELDEIKNNVEFIYKPIVINSKLQNERILEAENISLNNFATSSASKQPLNSTSMKTIPEIEKDKGKSKGWPKNFEYLYDSDTATLRLELNSLNDIRKKNDLRKIDSWALAAREFLSNELNLKVDVLEVCINCTTEINTEIEALKRRLSFLRNNNDLNLVLIVNGSYVQLYTISELFIRPSNEIIRKDYEKRKSDPYHDKLEKDLQSFLFGNKKEIEDYTNERLAIFGEDFFDLKGKRIKIWREFPTGAFNNKINSDNRILATEYIDIVTLNKWKELSIIELKINDVKLEVISQSLNYALFIAAYWKQLKENFFADGVGYKKDSLDFICYIVSNKFHDRFYKICKYYQKNKVDIPIKFKPIILGYSLFNPKECD